MTESLISLQCKLANVNRELDGRRRVQDNPEGIERSKKFLIGRIKSLKDELALRRKELDELTRLTDSSSDSDIETLKAEQELLSKQVAERVRLDKAKRELLDLQERMEKLQAEIASAEGE